MNYREYCKKYNLNFGSEQAAKMYYFYKEAESVSTDCNIKNENMNINQTYAYAFTTAAIPLAPLPPQDCCKTATVPCAKKGNNPMYVENDKHIESAKINYISDRASMAYGNKRNEMIEIFHLDTPEVPRTPELLVEAITSGNYTIKPKNERNTYDRATNQIIWRSADIKADQAGYDKALSDLTDFYQNVKDTVVIGTPAEAIAAIKTLDAWTPTVGNA